MIANFFLRIRRAVILLAIVMAFCDAHSASIEWDAFAVANWDSWTPGLWSIEFPLGGLTMSPNGDIGAAGSTYSYGNWVSYWVYATDGDALAVFEDYEKLPLAADLAFTSEDAISGENINTHRDSQGRLYLAIIAKEGDVEPKYYYGWVHLQDKTILASALSESPLYVGTGQVIPEPSSGTLALLGFVWLMLKRKRAFQVP